jgi:hypothetical protein
MDVALIDATGAAGRAGGVSDEERTEAGMTKAGAPTPAFRPCSRL